MVNRRQIRILIDEAERYLAAVDAFRAEGYEPRWRPEASASERG
jgi:hypothetical protein